MPTFNSTSPSSAGRIKNPSSTRRLKDYAPTSRMRLLDKGTRPKRWPTSSSSLFRWTIDCTNESRSDAGRSGMRRTPRNVSDKHEAQSSPQLPQYRLGHRCRPQTNQDGTRRLSSKGSSLTTINARLNRSVDPYPTRRNKGDATITSACDADALDTSWPTVSQEEGQTSPRRVRSRQSGTVIVLLPRKTTKARRNSRASSSPDPSALSYTRFT